MSAPTLVTVEAFGVYALSDDALRRVLDRERLDAWGSWLHEVVGDMLGEGIRERLDGVEDVRVPAWSILDGGRGSMVVEAVVVDPDTFAASLGLAGHDVGLGLTLDPYHARGSQWAGTTYVLRHDHDGHERDAALTDALDDVMRRVLADVEAYAEDAESDERLAEALDLGGWRFDRLGRHLDAVIVDEVVA